MALTDWDKTAANNATAGSVNWAEGQNPNTVNDSAREMMADVSLFMEYLGVYYSAGGTADALTITTSWPITAYAANQAFGVKATATNTTTTPTLNVDSVGTKTIKKLGGAALVAGDITNGDMFTVVYNGTDFIMTSPTRGVVGNVIGTDVQAYDAGLADIAGLAVTDGNIIVGNGANWVAESGATARTSLGLGTGSSPTFTSVTASTSIITDTIAEKTAATGVTIDGVVLKDSGITATGGGSLTGTWSNMGSVTTIDINGGTVDGAVIGGASASAGTFTTITGSGKLTVDGGAKISVQNQNNGGSGHGIFLWDTNNTTWGLYMAQAGTGFSLSDGTACTALDGSSSFHIRHRVPNTNGYGLIWENAAEQCLMSLTADTGDVYTKGGVYTADGGQAVPPHSFVSDPDSGMYSVSVDVLGFTAGGIRQLSLTAGTADFQGNDVTTTGFINHGTPAELTIATGVVTATGSFHTVDTEADAATDDLDTISGGTEGDILVIFPNNDARTIVLKNGTGNLNLGADITLDTTSKSVKLIFISSEWRRVNGA